MVRDRQRIRWKGIEFRWWFVSQYLCELWVSNVTHSDEWYVIINTLPTDSINAIEFLNVCNVGVCYGTYSLIPCVSNIQKFKNPMIETIKHSKIENVQKKKSEISDIHHRESFRTCVKLVHTKFG